MRFDITYRTVFAYEQLVRESQNELRACPTSDDLQQLISYRVTTSPSGRVMSFNDYWGTRVDAFGVRGPHLHLEVLAEASVETKRRPLLTSFVRPEALRLPAFLDRHIEYLAPSPHADWGRQIADTAAQAIAVAGDDVVGWVLALHRLVGGRLTYAPGSTYVGVDVDEVLASGKGVCQDFAHLAVALCRSVGIPARYVSGYLFTVDDSTGADVEADRPDGTDVVNVQTHAWFEAAVPGVGWLALDPTNRLEVGDRHVKIGHGRDYEDVAPLRGVYVGKGRAAVEAQVEIRRTSATPVVAADPFRAWPRPGQEEHPLPSPIDDRLEQQHQAQQQQQ
jgi:transglutaminase-like putative cysteine protease